jgi:DNA repair protein RadC
MAMSDEMMSKMGKRVKSEEPTPYKAPEYYRSIPKIPQDYAEMKRREELYSESLSSKDWEDAILRQALSILDKRIRGHEVVFTEPSATSDYLRLRLESLEHEVFAVLFLDNRHRLIEYEEMFRGTIDGASVHPREVVKAALKHNAAAVIFSHNHPSGVPEPSRADEMITHRLKDALALVDIRVLDHIVVGAGEQVSFAARGLL